MSGSPQWGLQQAIVTRLTDSALNTTLGAAVYDQVPDGSTYPYVVVGEATEDANDTSTKTGRDVTLTLHYWSQYRGMKEVHQIHNRVDELLHDWQPTVTGWDATISQCEFYESFRDPDGVTKHGVARYRIHLHQQ